MKKLLVLFLIIVLSFAFVACSGGGNTDDSANTPGSEQTGSQGGNQGGNQGGTTSQGGGTTSQGGNQGGTTPPPTISTGVIEKQGSVEITASYGGLETAFVTWKPVNNVGYTVYYKSATENYKKVDNELIRRYNDYFRVDVLGLKVGEYQIKVVPYVSGKEEDGNATVVKLSTSAHDREGFAFSSSSPNKTASGAYNEDGTLKANAQVLYITKDNINTIKLNVIKNSKNQTQEGVGLLDILYLRGKGYDKTPLAIRFIGTIKASDITWVTANVKQDEFNYVALKGCYNVTAEGVGSDATCFEWSFKVRAANNVEVRNFGFMLFKDDGVTIDTDNFNIWVHNNDFFYGSPGSDADQVKGDGSCDNKQSSYITVSYNHFWDSGKVNLCGMKSETEENCVTYHHNWFDHSDSRHPRIRACTVHVYNNYYDGVSKYGIGVTTGSSCFAENNYFLNTKKPILSSKQGTDAKGTGTFSGEDGGIVKAYGNKFVGSQMPIDYSANATSFDCYTVANRNDLVPANVKTLQGGTTYNNFDTNGSMYKYTADNAESVPQIVKAYAGRVNGGDFKWTFTDADNTSYTINTELKNKITNYKTSLISVGGI